MRQRATAHFTPPRPADSTDSNYSQRQDNKTNQSRLRQNYQLPLGELIQEPRAVSTRDVHGDKPGDGFTSTTVDSTSPIPEGSTRRRRVSAYQKDGSLGGHSPQHYYAETNSTFYNNFQYNHDDAPRSISSLPSHPPQSQNQNELKHAASQAFYSQYGSNYAAHQYDGRPGLFRQHSVPPSSAHKLSFQHFESTFHLDPNPLAALHFRKALHVPDKDYKSFIAGGERQNKAPVIHPICCANFCAGFSFVGFIFFIFVGILLDTQPLFIQGSLPSALKENDNGKATTIYFVTAERLPMATNAYQASYAYVFTMIACLIFAHTERFYNAVKRRSYQDVPDAEGSTVGVVGDGTLPNYHDGESHAASPAYQLSPWNRLVGAATRSTVKLREWAVTTTAGAWAGRPKHKSRKKTCAKTI